MKEFMKFFKLLFRFEKKINQLISNEYPVLSFFNIIFIQVLLFLGKI